MRPWFYSENNSGIHNAPEYTGEETVETNRSTAIAFGMLLIAAMVCGIFSSVTAIEEPDYLIKISSIESEMLVAVFFQAMMAISYIAIVVITCPLVRMANQRAAAAYLAFRLTGAAFLFAGIVTLLLLLSLGRQFAQADPADLKGFVLAGTLLRQMRDWLNHICMILPWSIGGIFIYSSFLKTGIIPRWMSIWGLAAAVLTLTATLLYMLDQIQLVTIIYFAMNVPTALLEIVLAIYLLAWGFRQVPTSLTRSQGN